MNNKVRAAVVGCGNISSVHLAAYQANKDCELVYTVDIIKERADAAKAKYGAKESLYDYKELIKRGDFDAVSLCVPNCLHDVMAADFMAAGKDVLSEKPASTSFERVQKMADAAEKNKKLLNVGVCMRFDTAVNAIKNIIESGIIGNIYHINCDFRSFRNIPGIGGHFTIKEKSGGGVLIDWGVHFLDLIIYAAAIKKVKTVSAQIYNKIGSDPNKYISNGSYGFAEKDGIKDVEDYVTGLVRTDSPTISFNGAWAQNINEERKVIEFLGDKGGIKYNYCGSYTLYTEQNGILYSSTPELKLCGMYAAEVDDFVRAVKERDFDARGNIKNVLAVSKLMDAAYRSAYEGKEIVL